LKKQIRLNSLTQRNLQAAQRPGGSRCDKTSVLLGLLQEANPKQGGKYQSEARLNSRNIYTSKPSLSHFILAPGSDSPTSWQLNIEADLSEKSSYNEISKLPSAKGEPMQ